jgi:WD40 repeat protein
MNRATLHPMRCKLLGLLGLVGCSPAIVGPPVAATPRSERAVSAPPPVVAPSPLAPAPWHGAISESARAQARAAFAQALELWSAGRNAEANSMVELGLTALGRRLPEDAAQNDLGSWLEGASVSADGTAYALGDTETLLVAEATTGRFMGLRVHDAASSAVGPSLSPKATVVIAPSAAELRVYEAKGLALRLSIKVRKDAPFSFLSDDKLVTVRLGDAAKEPPTARGQLLQRSISALPNSGGPPELDESTKRDAQPDAELSDDEIIVVDLRTGKTDTVYRLVPPPDQGMMRKVASLPPSQHCNVTDDCRQYELDPTPIGRRVEQLRIVAGTVVASWQGGATTFHRLRDGKLLGAFRSRGERWKPGLVAVWPKPPRAAVVTSLPSVGRGNEPPFSVTALFDLNQGRILEILDECRWATGLAFSADGTKLMVGDLRRACLHDGRSGRYLETTEEVRSERGAEDTLQDVSVRSVPSGRWLLTTADGTYGVFDEQHGRALFRGRNDRGAGLVASDDRSLFVADFSGGEAQLITFGPAGVERRLLRTEELEQKRLPPELADSPLGRRAAVLGMILQRSCLIEGFRLPRELCRLPQKTP